MITDDIQTAQLRRQILRSIEAYDIELLKRIAYECRCEEYSGSDYSPLMC